MKRIAILIFSIFYLSSFAYSQQGDVRSIIIISKWGGLGDSQNDKLEIFRKPKGDYANGKKIDSSLVNNFLKSLSEPTVNHPTLENLGINETWLKANALSAVEEYASVDFSFGAVNQKELYFNTFNDINFIENKILPSLMGGGWTDDYPLVTVEITYADGKKINIESDEQPDFMLPWVIDREGVLVKTHNAHISKALAALMSKKMANKSRLNGDGFRRKLASVVMRSIEKDWKRLEAENKASAPIGILRKTYNIASLEINPYHDSDYGKAWTKGNSTETNLHALLRQENFPKGFAIKLILPFHDGKVDGLDLFQSRADEYRNLVFSVPWLRDFIENNGNEVWLRFVKNRSFSEKAMLSFKADMETLGKNDLVTQVEKDQDKIALLSTGGGPEYYQSFWLVLPDKRVILWRADRHFLKWGISDFSGKKCSEPRSNTQPCLGAVISENGEIISK